MKSKWKIILMCCLMVAVIFLEPVSYALAEETSSDSTDEVLLQNDIPLFVNAEIDFVPIELFDLFGIFDTPDENLISEFSFIHMKNKDVDYSLYDLKSEFELKTKGENGDITTSTCSYMIDLEKIEINSVSPGIVTFFLEDGGLNHSFGYSGILENATGFQSKEITWGFKKYHTYNTVISQANFSLVRKSDGKEGLIFRYDLTWDSDFWMQKCTNISFSMVDPEIGFSQFVDEKGNSSGIFDFGSEATYVEQIMDLLISIPEILIALVKGFFDLIFLIPDFFKVVFPFIPGIIFDVFGILIFLGIGVAVWKFFKGG